MPEFYLDFDSEIIEAKDYDEAVKRGEEFVKLMKNTGNFPSWHIVEV